MRTDYFFLLTAQVVTTLIEYSQLFIAHINQTVADDSESYLVGAMYEGSREQSLHNRCVLLFQACYNSTATSISKMHKVIVSAITLSQQTTVCRSLVNDFNL